MKQLQLGKDDCRSEKFITLLLGAENYLNPLEFLRDHSHHQLSDEALQQHSLRGTIP